MTYQWVSDFVVRYHLCPFAGKPLKAGTIRFEVSNALDWATAQEDALRELELIANEPAALIETSLLIFPTVLDGFQDYLSFIEWLEAVLEAINLSGEIQVASFHPDYQFAGSAVNDPANHTNRSPFPMVHFIREESISKALEHYPDPEAIPARNIAFLQSMGLEAVEAAFRQIKHR
ncbi:MAG: DUF1415 domain-containing protein [Bacteroidota bacterium]